MNPAVRAHPELSKPHSRSAWSIIRATVRWLLRWLLLVLGICSAGALVGAVLYPVAGTLLGMDLPPARMLVNGLKDGGFYALIWAPGLALVICIMRAHKLYAGKGS